MRSSWWRRPTSLRARAKITSHFCAGLRASFVERAECRGHPGVVTSVPDGQRGQSWRHCHKALPDGHVRGIGRENLPGREKEKGDSGMASGLADQDTPVKSR